MTGSAAAERALAAWLDRTTLVLAAALAVWARLGAGSADGARPAPVMALAVGVTAAAALGRWSGGWGDRTGQVGRAGRLRATAAVPAAVAGGVGVLMVASLPGLDRADGPPLGYANANTTLAALGVIAAGGVALGAPVAATTRRENWLTGAAVLAGFVVIAGSLAGALALALVTGLVALAVWVGRGEVAVAGAVTAVGLALLATVSLAVGAAPADVDDRSGVRVDLWAAAVDLVADHPVRGIGPGAFAESNPVTWDPDLRWVHHEYLQAGAELGLPGLALLLALLAAAYGRLVLAARLQPPPGTAALVGTAAVTLVAVHATVDYVVHLALVPLVTALLFGWATATPPGRDDGA